MSAVESPFARPWALALLIAAACHSGTVQRENTAQCMTSVSCPAGEGCVNSQCVTLPCGGRCTNDQVCVANGTCAAADGISCATNPSICPTAFTCTPNGVCQRDCTGPLDCAMTHAYPYCNADLLVCGQCATNADCQAQFPSTPLCNPKTAECVGCIDNTSCYVAGAADGQICDPSTQTCRAGCTTRADCGIGAKSCTAGQCVQCDGDADCMTMANDVRCQTLTKMCVECLSDDDCGAVGGQCNLATNACVGCVEDAFCSPGDVCNQTEFQCVPGCKGGSSTPGSNCPTNPRLPVCDMTQGTNGACVSCLADGDCPRAEICDTTGAQPACIAGCRDNTACQATASDPSPSNTLCYLGSASVGTCVQCLSNDDCAGSANAMTCDSLSHMCRCKAQGEGCSATSECGYEIINGHADCNATGMCVQTVDCQQNGGQKLVAGVCAVVSEGGGVPNHQPPSTTGCPSGSAVEWGIDNNVTPVVKRQVCVPDTSMYTCQ